MLSEMAPFEIAAREFLLVVEAHFVSVVFISISGIESRALDIICFGDLLDQII